MNLAFDSRLSRQLDDRLEKDSKKMGLNNEAIKFYRINLSGGSEFTDGILEYSEINSGKTVYDINPVLIQPIKLSWITEK